MADICVVQKPTILDLSVETLALLFDFCEIAELRSLAGACKAFRLQVALPMKYRNVDGSSHNDGTYTFTLHHGGVYEMAADQYPPTYDLSVLARKQGSFVSALVKRQYLGRLTRDLKWTIRSRYDPTEEEPKSSLQNDIDPETQLWNAFLTFSNVTTVDLACYQKTWDWDYLRQPPPLLFPAATSIRLSGLMYRQVVEATLNSINLPRLKHLSFDNLQDPGFTKQKYPYQRQSEHHVLDGRFRVIETEEDHRNGTMRHILPSIQHQCSSLQTFFYSKPGAWARRYGGVSDSLNDERGYEEFASFIEATNSTLVHIHFEQGMTAYAIKNIREGTELGMSNEVGQPVGQSIKPMDARFMDLVYPMLMQCHWPRLQRLNIIGVGRWGGRAAMSRGRKLNLRKHLGKGVELVMEYMSEKPCWEYQV